jgi:hypothetical protein
MTQILPRFYRRQCEADDHAAVDAAVRESADPEETAPRATAAGDTRRLRGIPMFCRGVNGTAPGTDPLAALIASERVRYSHR